METKTGLFWEIMLSIAICFLFVFAFSGLNLTQGTISNQDIVAVECQVFENTQLSVPEMTQQLTMYKTEYVKATDINVKEGILSTVRLLYTDYDDTGLAPELKTFLSKAQDF